MSGSAPLVSVLMPVYNGERFIRQALRSVLQQSFAEFELLVVDDGSTDGTGEVLSAFSDPRLRVLRQENQGLVAALNYGLSEARGEFVARMDHDDISLPRRLELQLAYLEKHPSVAVVGCQFAQMDEDGNLLNHGVPLPLEQAGILHNIGRGRLGILHPTMMFRRQALLDAGGYDERVPRSEDVDLVYRLAARWQVGNIDRVGYLYRITAGAVSTVWFRRQRRNERILLRAWRRYLRQGSYFLGEEEYRRLSAPAVAVASPARSRSHYHNRVGRALLRGGHFREAFRHYLQAARNRPIQLLAYLGMLRSMLHSGQVHWPSGWEGVEPSSYDFVEPDQRQENND